MSVGPALTKRSAFYREGDEVAGPILVGVPAEVWQRVQELASDGSVIILRPAAAGQ